MRGRLLLISNPIYIHRLQVQPRLGSMRCSFRTVKSRRRRSCCRFANDVRLFAAAGARRHARSGNVLKHYGDKRSEALEVEQRWTVTNMSTSIGAVSRGHGFAWLPQDKIRTEIEDGSLKILPLRGGRQRTVQLYLIFADRDAAGPGVLRLAEIVREEVQRAGPSRL